MDLSTSFFRFKRDFYPCNGLIICCQGVDGEAAGEVESWTMSLAVRLRAVEEVPTATTRSPTLISVFLILPAKPVVEVNLTVQASFLAVSRV